MKSSTGSAVSVRIKIKAATVGNARPKTRLSKSGIIVHSRC